MRVLRNPTRLIVASLTVAAATIGAGPDGSLRFMAMLGEPLVAQVTFSERSASRILVTFQDDGAPTGPDSGRYDLIVNASSGCADDIRVRPYNPDHRPIAPGILPPLVVRLVPGPDGGMVGDVRYVHLVRGLAMRGPASIHGHDLLLIGPKSNKSPAIACMTIGA